MNKTEGASSETASDDSGPQAITLLNGRYWKVLLNPDQQNLGKCLVVLHNEKQSLADLTPHEWEEFGVIVKALEKAIAAEFSPTHFNWQCLMNNSYGSGAKEVAHVHWHVTPRYAQPVMVDEHEFVDENYPRTNKEAKFVEQDILHKIASKILSNYE
jgi:diadenosine tetraphosphate (Ap4A) HIT family hydrolase